MPLWAENGKTSAIKTNVCLKLSKAKNSTLFEIFSSLLWGRFKKHCFWGKYNSANFPKKNALLADFSPHCRTCKGISDVLWFGVWLSFVVCFRSIKRKVELVQLNFQRSVLPEEYYMWHFTSWYFDLSPLAAGMVVVLCIYIILKTSLPYTKT